MARKNQSTNLHRNFGEVFVRLERWASNPWRRYSLFLIVLLTGYLVGSSIGAINGVLALMDPIGAFLTVSVLEVMVRLRRSWSSFSKNRISLNLMDIARIGLLYGLLSEGFKLL